MNWVVLLLLQAAFLFGYPEELVYKLFERKGKCLFEFHGFKTSNAVEAINKAIETVGVSKLNDAKKEEYSKVMMTLENRLKPFW